MASSWYSPKQAVGIALGFAILDILVNILGLAWNGEYFTFDNISHWFNLKEYSFKKNPVDFLVSFGLYKIKRPSLEW